MLDALLFGVPAYAIFVAVMMYVAAVAQQTSTVSAMVVVAYLPLYVFPILYEALMLTIKSGQTVGKMALRLRVVRSDGSRITAAQAWGRAVMRLVLGCFIIVDYIPFFFTDERTTLHDMVAGTRVVEM